MERGSQPDTLVVLPIVTAVLCIQFRFVYRGNINRVINLSTYWQFGVCCTRWIRMYSLSYGNNTRTR